MYSDQIDFPARQSAAWRDFVRRALQKQPHLRPTAAQLLAHPWLKPARADNIPRSVAVQPMLPQSSSTSTAHAASLKIRLESSTKSAPVHAASGSAPVPSARTASCNPSGPAPDGLDLPPVSHPGPLADAATAHRRAAGAPAEAQVHTASSGAASTGETAVSAVSSMSSELSSTSDQAPTAGSAFVDAGSSAASCTEGSPGPDASRAERAGHAVVARLAGGRAVSKGTGVTVLRAGLALLHAPDSAERPFSSSTPASPTARLRSRPCLLSKLISAWHLWHACACKALFCKCSAGNKNIDRT